MTFIQSIRNTFFAFALAYLISGCATAPAARALDPRFLGYSEIVKQGDKKLFSGAHLVEQSRFAATAGVQSLGANRQLLVTTVHLKDFRQAIIRRELPNGGFEGSFGKEAELIFSLQPCTHWTYEDRIAVCADQPAAVPIVVHQKAVLTGGNKIVVQFPGDIEWTYEVLDQSSPILGQ